MEKATIILRPLKRISPSQFTSLNKCPYRVVLANSCSRPLLPYPPASHLGNVIHECIRLILTGKLWTSSDFDEVWNRLLSKEERTLEDMGFAFFTPISENVQGYTIKKLQVKSLLKTRVRPTSAEKRKTDNQILTEKWLEAQDSLIGGYADIIINSNGYTKLSDFKSGKILLEEGGIKDEFEDQLKLYAYLHSEVFGKYPDELSIIDLEKKEYSIAFKQQECKDLAAKSREAFSEINSLIEKDEREALARPEMDNCKRCLYRPACKFYWKLPMAESYSVFRDIKGKVADVKQFHNGNLNVILNKDKREMIVSQLNKEYLPFLSDHIGKELAFYNVKQSEISHRYRALKTTKIYEV